MTERPQHPPYTDPVYKLATQLVDNADRAQKLLTETWAERAERIEKEQAEKKEATK